MRICEEFLVNVLIFVSVFRTCNIFLLQVIVVMFSAMAHSPVKTFNTEYTDLMRLRGLIQARYKCL